VDNPDDVDVDKAAIPVELDATPLKADDRPVEVAVDKVDTAVELDAMPL
jgi:hypothetical protein